MEAMGQHAGYGSVGATWRAFGARSTQVRRHSVQMSMAAWSVAANECFGSATGSMRRSVRSLGMMNGGDEPANSEEYGCGFLAT